MDSAFASLPLSTDFLTVVAELGFTSLTPIQAKAMPVLLSGRDLVGQSQTGSGKTVAFALPILQRLALEPRRLKALVLCPTRELSAQVAREFRKLGRRLKGLSVIVLSGGEPLRSQAGALRRGVHIAVGTPGRILDHLERGNLDLQNVTTAVLDEADRMLGMGFQEDMEWILDALPTPRQTLFFSATFPESIEQFSRKYQRQPVKVEIEAALQPAEVRQVVYAAEVEDKLQALRWLLAQHPHESALVFANFKVTVAKIEADLAQAHISVASLHGDLEQVDRDRVMAKFRNGSTRVLVATDVAARGLDIQDLDLVVNFEMPSQPEMYVHRIGRTGRAGKSGLAISLCASNEGHKLNAIEQTAHVALARMSWDSSKSSERESAPTQARSAAMVTLRIAGGRKAKLRPGDILGALTGEAAGLNAEDVGKIEIHDHFSYVAVAKAVSTLAQARLNEGRIKGKRYRTTFVK